MFVKSGPVPYYLFYIVKETDSILPWGALLMDRVNMKPLNERCKCQKYTHVQTVEIAKFTKTSAQFTNAKFTNAKLTKPMPNLPRFFYYLHHQPWTSLAVSRKKKEYIATSANDVDTKEKSEQ